MLATPVPMMEMPAMKASNVGVEGEGYAGDEGVQIQRVNDDVLKP